MENIILEAKGLTKDYGKNRGIFNIDFKVQEGEVFGFIGTNGSGKTTTIRNMMGFIRPDSGITNVMGKDSWKCSADIMQNVSYVPGEISFPALATGTDFLKSQAEYLGVTDFSYMNHVIELLQLDPTANLKRMSKGMKQKTAIVAALMGEKKVIVLDEPTTGLDPLMRDSFLEIVREEKKKGHTIFMSSHIFEEIEEVCDRVAMIKDGHIIDVISLHELRHPNTKNIIIEFNSELDRNHFLEKSKFKLNKKQDNYCDIEVPVTKLDVLFKQLKQYQIINLQENHMSLQKHFMMKYKEGAGNNGSK